MSKISKVIFSAISILVLMIFIFSINSHNVNKQKADYVKSKVNTIQLPSYLKIVKSEWRAAFLPDSRDSLENVYVSDASGSTTYSDLLADFKKQGFAISNDQEYKSVSGYDSFGSFGSFSASKDDIPSLDVSVMGKSGSKITVSVVTK